jgi:hypothetical protein
MPVSAAAPIQSSPTQANLRSVPKAIDPPEAWTIRVSAPLVDELIAEGTERRRQRAE